MRTLVIAVLSLGLLAAVDGRALAKTPTEEANEAKEHYTRGQKLYDLGKYDEAIKEFEAAYEIKDNPVLLYNIAQAYRLANKYPEALRFYRTYLKRSPKAPNKPEVDAKITDMENLIAQQNAVQNGPPSDVVPPGTKPPVVTNAKPITTPPVERKPPPTIPPDEDNGAGNNNGNGGETRVASVDKPETRNGNGGGNVDEPEDKPEKPAVRPEKPLPVDTGPSTPAERPAKPGQSKLIAGIVIAVVGVAAAGGGVAMGMLAMSDANAQQSSPKFDPALESAGKMKQTVGVALDAAGGALAVTGAVIAAIGATQNAKAAERKVSVLPAVAPGYAGASLGFRF